MDNTFIIIWDSTGLIGIIDVSGYDKKQMWSILKGNEPKSLIQSIRSGIIDLESKNTSYEIYSISTVAGTTAKEIGQMFNDNPVHSAELIRAHGNNLKVKKKELA